LSFVQLLDAVSRGGTDLRLQSEGIAGRVDPLLLPIFEWLSALRGRAEEMQVPWGRLDSSWSTEDTAAVQQALAAIVQDRDDPGQLNHDLSRLRRAISEGLSRVQTILMQEGVESQSVRRLLLPIESHLSSWTVQQESSDVVDRARSALGEVGAARLALSFDAQFESDRRQANVFRILAICAIVFSAVWSLLALLELASNSTGAGAVVGRIVVAVSFLTLGGFFTRESWQHRNDANVWRTVQLQLNAIEAYSAPLSRETREALRFQLGLAVFSGPALYERATGPARRRRRGESGADDDSIRSPGDALITVRTIAQALHDFRGQGS